jgi:hypothetical protein
MIKVSMQYKEEDGVNGDMIAERAWAMLGKVHEYLHLTLNKSCMLEARPLGKTKGMPDFNVQIVIYSGPSVREVPQELRVDLLHLMVSIAWPHEQIFLTIERSSANWGLIGGDMSR